LFYSNPHIQPAQKSPTPQSSIFTSIKKSIKSTYSDVLDSQKSGLLMGIVFGEKDMDTASMKNFQKTGVLHIIAASGMNVSMLTGFLLAVLILVLRRQKALILTFGIIIFYTALAGFQPSIVRAAIMASLALGAGIIGRQNSSFLALLVTGFLMVFWDPSVILSISFILSFAATAGIIFIDPIFKQLSKKSAINNSLLEDFTTTLSAQIATTPIILFFFGSYSPVSIIVYLLVLWTVPPLMLLGGLAALLSFIPGLASLFVLLSLPLLSYFIEVVNFFARISFQFSAKNTPWTLIAGYYLILFAILFYSYRKKSLKI